MKEVYRILVINPGSTSTKIAVFENDQSVFDKSLQHDTDQLKQFAQVSEQLSFRMETILATLAEANITLDSLDAIAARGGLLHPLAGGTYQVNEQMLLDLKAGTYGQHASNLAALIAYEIASGLKITAFIVDPVVVDELAPLARLSGHAQFKRVSIFHALNQKAVARIAAKKLGKLYSEVNLIVAHMGGGISVGVHEQGQVVDVNNALNGEGPFSPERSGTIPFGQLIDACFSGQYEKSEIHKMLVGQGGLSSYLGTNDCIKIEKMVEEGHEEATLVYQAMAYQVAKEIGAASTVLKGQIDGIVLTGGLAHSNMLVDLIRERVAFLAPILTIPGEKEMSALAAGVLRVLQEVEQVKVYGEPALK